MLKNIKKKTNLIFLIFVILISLPSIFGLIHQGFPLTDDGNWMIIRFSAFYEALRSGEFPVRFLTRLNNGFGYPVSNFLYPLFMYLGSPIHVLGINFVDTIKIILVSSLIFSSIFTFFWLRKIFDNIASFVGSILYVLFPYHLYDVYKRGSVGEVLALTIVPFVLWQVERKSILLTSIGISLLVLSHNTLALLFIPLIFLYTLLKDKKLLKFILLTIFFGMGMSSFFWIPAIYDTRFTVFSKTKVSEYYNYFINLNNFDVLGIVSVVLIFSSLMLLLINKKTNKNKLFLFSTITSFLILFLVTPVSNILWQVFPITNLIQFPFRLLSILMIILTFQVGFLISNLNKVYKTVVVFIFLALIFISAKPHLSVNNYQYYPDSFYSTNMDTTTVKNEYMPRWVKEKNLKFTPQRVENLNGEEKINVAKVSPREIVFNTFLTEERTLQINLVYFPGWNAYVNGIKDKINYENDGLIKLNLQKGQNNVKVVFEETNMRILSDFLSIISIAGLLILVFSIRAKKFKYEIYK